MADNIIRVYPGGQSSLAGNTTEASILAQIPALVPAAVESSGILLKNDIIPIVANAPLLLERNQVWVKGNICYVNLVFKIPAQVNIAANTLFSPTLCSGMPLMPGTTGSDGDGGLVGVLRYGRATMQGSNRCFPCQIYNGLLLLCGDGSPLLGNPTTGFDDFITISGHYLLNLTDSNP